MSNASKATATAYSVSVAVTERLRAEILAGEFKPGERLYEVPLSERFGVSRTPVRSALQTLASDGLLEYSPNRGYSVRMFETADVIEAYEIRAVLEGLAARRAAQIGLSDAGRRALEDALIQGDRLLARGHLVPGDRIAYGAINATIHHTIHAAGGTRMLGDTLRLSAQIAPASHRNVIAFEYRDVRRRHDDHHRIFEAILCRDSGRAELLMRDHVESVKMALIRSISATASSPDRVDALSTELNRDLLDRRPESQPLPEF
jgi:GntR family transcriptional regulator of vanillate catabolism